MPTTGLFKDHAPGRAVELGVAEAEHAAVGGDQPVAVSRRASRDADDRRAQGRGDGAEVHGIALGEDLAAGVVAQ
jgi:hypothetical protein